MKNKLNIILFILILSVGINSALANIVKNQLGIKFSSNDSTLSEKLKLINDKLIEINADLPKPLSTDYINYYGNQFDIIISINQPININAAVVELAKQPYIELIEAVGAITIY